MQFSKHQFLPQIQEREREKAFLLLTKYRNYVIIKLVYMKIIILEGIPTSGKTSLIKEIEKHLRKSKKSYKIVFEDETFMPMLENKNVEIANAFLSNLLENYSKLDIDILVLDRFHYSLAFRTQSDLVNFKIIDKILLKYNTNVVLLKLPINVILERLKDSLKHRDSSWTEYLDKKGDDSQKLKYYTNQQEQLFKLASQSNLTNLCISTENKNWKKYAQTILCL